MDVDPLWKFINMCKIKKECIWEFEDHMPLLEAVEVHWPDDECLTYWTWMPSLEHVCFGLLPNH